MTEFPDLSRLPDDEEYWERLEARVLAGLGAPGALPPAEWWAPLAGRAYALGAVAAAAATLALLLLPPRSVEPSAPPTGILRPPVDDPELAAFLSAPEPPTIGALMLPTDGRGPND
jgi:hypothetical protein